MDLPDPHDEPHKLSCSCYGLRLSVDRDLVARLRQKLFARILDDRFSGGGTGNLFVASNPGIDHVLVEQDRVRLASALSTPGSGDEPLGLKG